MRYTVVEEVAVLTGESSFTHYGKVGAVIELAEDLAAPYVDAGQLELVVAEGADPSPASEVTGEQLTAWLAAEDAYKADVGEWLEAEVEHQVSAKSGRGRRGEAISEP